MKDRRQFGESPAARPANGPSGQLDCAAVELLAVEAAEGTLPAGVAERVRAHVAECSSCREKALQARKGREWLLMLKQEDLVPPSDLVAKILSRTAGASDLATHSASRTALKLPVDPVNRDTRFLERYSLPGRSYDASGLGEVAAEMTGETDLPGREDVSFIPSTPVWNRPSVVLLRKTVFDPRIALVAAMAFFSISLTLNLLGVNLTRIRAADLEPQSMRRAVTRQYAEANARVVHYYENLRIVYEVESRVHQLRQAADSSPVPDKTGYKQGSGAGGNGQVNQRDRSNQSSRDGLHRERMEVIPVTDRNARPNRSAPAEPDPIVTGPVIDARLDVTPCIRAVSVGESVRLAVDSEFLSPASQGDLRLLQIDCFPVLERNLA